MLFRPAFAGRPAPRRSAPRLALPASSLQVAAMRSIGLAVVGIGAILVLAAATTLLTVRATHGDRIFPSVTVADVPVGGMTLSAAAEAISSRAVAIESSPISLSYNGKTWTSTLRDIGVTVDAQAVFAKAYGFGREDSALLRVRSAAALARSGEQLAMPMNLDYKQLDQWFGQIDRDLGNPPHNASLKITGSDVAVVPEVDGLVVDRERARSEIETHLENLKPISLGLPVTAKIATVRAVDLAPARELLLRALAHPVQVTHGAGVWTLPASDLAGFVTQDVVRNAAGAPAIELGLDKAKLAAWLDQRLAADIDTDPVNAQVGWDGGKVVSVVPSVDGVKLDAPKLAEQVEGQFFGDGGTVDAPVTYVKPTVDSANLGALGITSFLGTGTSNYSGSEFGRAHNVEVGAQLLNGTLIPPWGEFSFNEAIGLIDEDKGFVEAQVIDGESIGKDIGGGICQVSTTVFRAAYLAGLPIDEWWPHRFRIGFYELDGWEPGLDASIFQPTDDPSTWADFKFENPSDSWMLVESWADGQRVVVNLYGADLGYQVESIGPTWGAKTQMLPPQEVVDSDLDPGTVMESQVAGIGEEISQYRVVRDRDGNVLWERSFYTKYFARGDVWKVSPDMKGQAPIDADFKAPPVPPAGVDSKTWVPGEDAPVAPEPSDWTTPTDGAGPQSGEWVPTTEGSASA
jgi:vancomycin resistance protein YoaR